MYLDNFNLINVAAYFSASPNQMLFFCMVSEIVLS